VTCGAAVCDQHAAAALEARGGEGSRAKEWKMARDATHSIIELSHGWTRRTVLAVRHGDSRERFPRVHEAADFAIRRVRLRRFPYGLYFIWAEARAVASVIACCTPVATRAVGSGARERRRFSQRQGATGGSR
jgi:hypothetical protein